MTAARWRAFAKPHGAHGERRNLFIVVTDTAS
jgi:hypothetical protein